MAVNPGIFNALMRPVRSVADYHDQYNRQDMQQQALQRNALLMMQEQQDAQLRQQQAEAQRQGQNALMAAVGGVDVGDNPRLRQFKQLALAGAIPPKDFLSEVYPKAQEPKYQTVGSSLVRVAGDKVEPVFTAPEKQPAPPEIVRLMQIRDALPAGDPQRAMIDAKIRKDTTHAPAAVAVSYGAPVPFSLPDGATGYAQPGNRPGAVTQVMTDPKTGKPLVKPPEGAGKVGAEIQRMNIAADSMVALLSDYEKWLKSNNPRDPVVQMSPGKRAEMQSLMKNIQLQYKELAALGALTGPDLALMEAALTDPFTFRGAWYGPEGLMSQVGQARKLVDVRRKAIATNTGAKTQGETPAAPSGLPDMSAIDAEIARRQKGK